MSTITIWSEGGGVGKTTTTYNLAAALRRLGEYVLVIDADPQPGSLTDYAGYPEVKSGDQDVTLVDVLLDGTASLKDIIIEGDGIDLVPSHEALGTFESQVHSKDLKMSEFRLKSALESVKDEYDYVLIDPPATLNKLVDNALFASDEVLVPMELNRKGERSVSGVIDTLDALEEQLSDVPIDFEIGTVDVVPNKVSGSTLNQEVRASVADEDFTLLDITIPDYTVMEKAWDEQMDIFTYADEYGLRVYQEDLLRAYMELARYITDAEDAESPRPEVTV